ncbi:MAG TPA: Lrp/AsnC family transcriptional regulator [Candidatus Thermoplasmatota archaeon]|nr:Lrp/AsnC family transcriptional regulator [Candidatus Thermoplasmatota archaeon]
METATPAGRPKLDQVSRRILAHLAAAVPLDAAAIGQAIGASEQVVAERLRRLVDGGVVAGPGIRVNPAALGEQYEVLVSGAPTAATDRDVISRLCRTPGVTRVFGLASSHALAFTVAGPDPAAAQAQAQELARSAGLADARSALIVSTFRDAPGLPLAGASPTQGPGMA